MRPRRGHQRLASLLPDLPQPNDEVRQEASRDRSKQRIRRNRDDERREQGLVDDLRDNQYAQRARGPDQVVVEAERGGIVLLQEAAFRLFRRKQPARHGIAETRRYYAGKETLGNLFDANGQ